MLSYFIFKIWEHNFSNFGNFEVQLVYHANCYFLCSHFWHQAGDAESI